MEKAMPDHMMPLFETQYLPSVAWCTAVWGEQAIALDASEHYQKGSLRNRCYLAGANGPQRLSIPLEKGKHQQTPIREVRISYSEPWQRQHWRSIQAAYGNAPYYEHYIDELRPFYEQTWSFLFDYNLAFLEFILKRKLGWNGEITLQSEYFPPGKWMLGPDRRGDTGIGVNQLPSWFLPLRYPQVFEARSGFLPNLSIVDLLFCCGKTGAEVLSCAHNLPN